MAKASADTPLMQQHRSIKTKYPDAILLFRVGDFYETFGQDAVITAGVLGITLTKRNNGGAADNELAGFPYHALDTYLHKLVKAGYRVAICDQLEDPKQAKGLVKRGVTEMVTPGTATGDKLLDGIANNFLAAIHPQGDLYGLSFLDLSTGEFFVAQGDRDAADKWLADFQPSELLYARPFAKAFRESFGGKYYTYALDQWIFSPAYADEVLLRQFGTHSLKGFGIEGDHAGAIAAGATLHYLRETEHPHLSHITSLGVLHPESHLWMDRFTVRNLELVHAPEGGTSLVHTLDRTATPMGARLLRRWTLHPLRTAAAIEDRLQAVEHLVLSPDLRQKTGVALRACGDVERLVSKIPSGKISPRELLHLARALEQTEVIKTLLLASPQPLLIRLGEALNPCTSLSINIKGSIAEGAGAVASKGGFVAAGANGELDELRAIAGEGREWLQRLQEREAARTGISSLKVGYNNVFGYFLEVTNTHRGKAPPEWVRKQTLANAERYITEELKTYEEKLSTAEARMLEIEMEVYASLLTAIGPLLSCIQTNAHTLATVDCLLSFAETALAHKYTKPTVYEGETLSIEGGRHPVIERMLPAGEPFIANDLTLDKEAQQIIILTGPNMSGKSALLRQTALLVLMAHMGSFVPASNARVPLTDKIFTRVGASDNMGAGESTFMVEMNETASILNNLTDRSLIILDEIGRGTSTYDGISIAWSIVEYLHAAPQAPLTLFATHYHELNELEGDLERVKNFHITNREAAGKILFLRKLAVGGSTHSFGIHVARMAGMPPSLVSRATELLTTLEKKSEGLTAAHSLKGAAMPKMQLSIFDAHSQTFERIRESLDAVDINRLTPVEALLKLQEIKGMLK